MALGIRHERIEPGHPEQNGRHERMHRTLKQETLRPPAYSIRAQQARFDAFRTEFNQERPHEAIEDDTPASRYTPSLRQFPRRIDTVEYPAGYKVRTVAAGGRIRWKSAHVTIGHALEASQSASKRCTACTKSSSLTRISRTVTHVSRVPVTHVPGLRCHPCTLLLRNGCSSPAGLGARVERNTHHGTAMGAVCRSPGARAIGDENTPQEARAHQRPGESKSRFPELVIDCRKRAYSFAARPGGVEGLGPRFPCSSTSGAAPGAALCVSTADSAGASSSGTGVAGGSGSPSGAGAASTAEVNFGAFGTNATIPSTTRP